MVELREPNYYDDEESDICGNYIEAILKVNNITIPLCKDCLEDLKSSIKEFDELELCCRCENLVSRGAISLYHYGGTCTVTGYDADYFDRCKCSQFKKKELSD